MQHVLLHYHIFLFSHNCTDNCNLLRLLFFVLSAHQLLHCLTWFQYITEPNCPKAIFQDTQARINYERFEVTVFFMFLCIAHYKVEKIIQVPNINSVQDYTGITVQFGLMFTQTFRENHSRPYNRIL